MDFSKLTGAFRPPMPKMPKMDMTIQPQGAANYGNGGDEPPTPDDSQQSVTHHLSSITYNAKHAAAHHTETAKHAQALLNLLKKVPGFARHARKV